MLIAVMSANTMLFLVATVVTTGLLLFRSHRQAKRVTRRAVPVAAALEQRIKPAPAGGLRSPTSAEGWEVRMHDLARDVVGRLDSKITALQQLMIEAEEQSARLEALLAQAERQQVFSPAAEPVSNKPTAKPVSVDALAEPPSIAAVVAQAAARMSAAPTFPPSTPRASELPEVDDELAAELEPVPTLRLHRDPPAASLPQSTSPGRRYDRIYALADSGHSKSEIAEQLGSPIGEVELILSLRDKT